MSAFQILEMIADNPEGIVIVERPCGNAEHIHFPCAPEVLDRLDGPTEPEPWDPSLNDY